MQTLELTLRRSDGAVTTTHTCELGFDWPAIAAWLKQRNDKSSAAVDLMTLCDALNKTIASQPVPLTPEFLSVAGYRDALEWAWTIIANAGGGDWSRETGDWQTAAASFRDQYHALLSRALQPVEPIPPKPVSVFYGLADWEQLDDSLRGAIERVLDEQGDQVRWPIVFFEFRRLDLPLVEDITNWILEYVLDRLDEDFGNADGEQTLPTVAMQNAATILAVVIRRDYQVFACARTGATRTITEAEANDILSGKTP